MKNRDKQTSEFQISRDEWIIIGSVLAFAFVWIIFITPAMMYSEWFKNLIPPIKYLIYHVGHIILTFIVFGTPTGFTIKKKFSFWGTVRGGIFSWLCISFIIDIWIAPFSINPDGNFIISEGETLIGAAVDYMMGWSYTIMLPGIQNVCVTIPFYRTFSMLFVLTYFLTPVLAAFLMALLLRPKTFKNLVVR
jgi:hypothetical protein